MGGWDFSLKIFKIKLHIRLSETKAGFMHFLKQSIPQYRHSNRRNLRTILRTYEPPKQTAEPLEVVQIISDTT